MTGESPMEVPRSAIRSWCFGELTRHAKVMVVSSRQMRQIMDALVEAMATVEAALVAGGITVIDDEGGNQ